MIIFNGKQHIHTRSMGYNDSGLHIPIWAFSIPLNVDIIQSPSFAIHTDHDTFFFQIFYPSWTGKLGSLVWINNFRFTICWNSLFFLPQVSFPHPVCWINTNPQYIGYIHQLWAWCSSFATTFVFVWAEPKCPIPLWSDVSKFFIHTSHQLQIFRIFWDRLIIHVAPIHIQKITLTADTDFSLEIYDFFEGFSITMSKFNRF